MNQKIGSKNELQKTEKDLRTQLKGEKMQDIKDKLKDKVIERVSMENAISVRLNLNIEVILLQDLKNLAKVVDDAIIQYHTQKMEQINSILGDYWPRVYTGNDIESIQIK
jgi:DNA repair protein RAD50